jgi:hypothetical protein
MDKGSYDSSQIVHFTNNFRFFFPCWVSSNRVHTVQKKNPKTSHGEASFSCDHEFGSVSKICIVAYIFGLNNTSFCSWASHDVQIQNRTKTSHDSWLNSKCCRSFVLFIFRCMQKTSKSYRNVHNFFIVRDKKHERNIHSWSTATIDLYPITIYETLTSLLWTGTWQQIKVRLYQTVRVTFPIMNGKWKWMVWLGF